MLQLSARYEDKSNHHTQCAPLFFREAVIATTPPSKANPDTKRKLSMLHKIRVRLYDLLQQVVRTKLNEDTPHAVI